MRNLIFPLILAFATPAGAADGDDCATTRSIQTQRGSFGEACIILCDTKTSSDSTCSDYDLTEKGYPDIAIFILETATACSGAYSVDINTTSGAGNEHDVATLNATTTRSVRATDGASINQIIATDLATMTDCTDLTVTLHLLYRKR